MRTGTVFLAVAVTFCACSAVTGQEGARKIGPITIRPDSAFAKNEHPRLLFRQRDLPKYRARIAGPMKVDFDRFKAYWDGKTAKPGYVVSGGESMEMICLAVLYQLTGEKKYADFIRKSPAFKKEWRFYQRPFTVDLIFDTLTLEEVKLQTDLFLRNAEKKFVWGSKQSALWPALVFHGAGTGRDKEIEKWMVTGYKAAKGQIAHCNKWAGDRGGDYNSFSYIGNHTVIHAAAHLTVMKNALGEDSWQESIWARNLGSYYVYHYPPWTNTAIHFGNMTTRHIGPLHGSLGAGYLLAAAPAEYRDGLQKWWLYNNLVHQNPRLKGWPKTAREMTVMNGLWGRILFHDPDIPTLEPKDFPPSRFFRFRGVASMRENWSVGATFVHFTTGTSGDILPDGRQNADANTFTIYKKGILALDTGGQHALDANRLKFKPGADFHNHNYARNTIAHNGVLVYRPNDVAPGSKPGPAVGGQLAKRKPPAWKKARGYGNRKNFPLGIPLAWETSEEYDYVAGDATNAYDPATLKSFTRQLVYVRPNLVFLFDRVETAADGTRATWLLHTADKPETDGKDKPDKRIHPEGHFQWTGSTITITDERMGGRMFCKILLPEKREVRLRGGKFHDFELMDGRNIGPTEETYKSRGLGLSRALGEGVGGWRVEVDDLTGSRSVRFLHVFQTADNGTAKMVPCELVRKGDQMGARVKLTGGTVEVFFNSTGKVGGRVVIQGQNGVNRPLATTIVDDYDRWKKHPDYQKWMTDPFRRSVVMGVNP